MYHGTFKRHWHFWTKYIKKPRFVLTVSTSLVIKLKPMNILLQRNFIDSTDCLWIIKMSLLLSNEQSQFLTSSEISFLKCLVTSVNCKESKNSYLQSCSVRLSFSVQYKVVHHDLSSWDCNHIKVLHLTLKPIHSFESMKIGNISLCFHVIRVGLSAEFYIFS